MTPEQAIIERLADLPAVTAIASTRIRELKFRQGETWPAVRVSHISEVTFAHLRGSGSRKRTRVQIDSVVQETSGVNPVVRATDLAAAIEGDGGGSGSSEPSGLAGWRGTIGDVQIDAIFKIASTLDYESAELRLVRMSEDYMVHWCRAA